MCRARSESALRRRLTDGELECERTRSTRLHRRRRQRKVLVAILVGWCRQVCCGAVEGHESDRVHPGGEDRIEAERERVICGAACGASTAASTATSAAPVAAGKGAENEAVRAASAVSP